MIKIDYKKILKEEFICYPEKVWKRLAKFKMEFLLWSTTYPTRLHYKFKRIHWNIYKMPNNLEKYL